MFENVAGDNEVETAGWKWKIRGVGYNIRPNDVTKLGVVFP
jgi:hypothetical protein